MNAQQLRALAHDMRAPLGAIAALAELLQKHAGDAERTRAYAEQLREACGQLLALAQEMLEGETQRVAVVTPEALARSAAGLFGERIALQVDGDYAAAVLAQEQTIRRILVNLLGNAVKYTPDGGAIVLAVCAQRGEQVCRVRFSVRDAGIGMGKETLSRLFAPYARGQEAQAAGIPGTGLGLYGAREMARALGGDIGVKSEPGQGSEFTLHVSLALDRERRFDGMHFLIAEDNALARDALCELLESHGAKAEPAADGREAVRLFAGSGHNVFDAVLMDMLLPEMDGCAAAEAIRRLDRADAKAVPILALTGAASPEAAQRAKASGMSAHMAKPLTMKALADMLACANALR